MNEYHLNLCSLCDFAICSMPTNRLFRYLSIGTMGIFSSSHTHTYIHTYIICISQYCNYTRLQCNAVSDFVPALSGKSVEYWISQHHFASVTLDSKITIDKHVFLYCNYIAYSSFLLANRSCVNCKTMLWKYATICNITLCTCSLHEECNVDLSECPCNITQEINNWHRHFFY